MIKALLADDNKLILDHFFESATYIQANTNRVAMTNHQKRKFLWI